MVFIFGHVSIALPSLHFIKAMLPNTAADLDAVRIQGIRLQEWDSNCSSKVFCDTIPHRLQFWEADLTSRTENLL